MLATWEQEPPNKLSTWTIRRFKGKKLIQQNNVRKMRISTLYWLTNNTKLHSPFSITWSWCILIIFSFKCVRVQVYWNHQKLNSWITERSNFPWETGLIQWRVKMWLVRDKYQCSYSKEYTMLLIQRTNKTNSSYFSLFFISM